MKILLSPSKTLSKNNTIQGQQLPIFAKEALIIHKEIMSLNHKQIETFYGVSEKLANQVFDIVRSNQQGAAIGFYQGEVFKHLHANTWSLSMQRNARESLRVLSAMYGLLHPYDLIHPYRLDFVTDFKSLGLPSSYNYWSSKVTDFFLAQLKPNELIFNLASKEFSTVFNKHQINQVGHWVDVDFLSNKNGTSKIITMTAKKARGLFTRLLLEHPIDKIEHIYQINEFDKFTLDLKESKPNHLRYVTYNK